MKQWKQMISTLFVCCMVIMFMPIHVSADEMVPVLDESFFAEEPVPFETSGNEFTFFGLGSNGLPEMKDTSEVRWIDRIADLPEYAMDLYNWLWENSDGDKTEDALIDVTQAYKFDENDYGYPVVNLGHIAADFTFEKGVSQEQLGTVMNKPANEAFNAILKDTAKEAREYVLAVAGAFSRDNAAWFWSGRTTLIGYEITNYQYETYDRINGTGRIGGDVILKYCVKGTSSSGEFDVRAEKYQMPNEIYKTKRNMETIIEELVSRANEYNSRKKKLDRFNDYLTENNCYNTSEDLNDIDIDCRTIVSALIGSIGTEGPICEAYAKAFKVLCDRINIPCVLVSGLANNGEHMWNYVQLNDGKWYAVDVTWNDPTGGKQGAVSGNENDTYFLIGSNSVGYNNIKFSDSHITTNIAMDHGPQFINGPVLEDNAYNGILAELAFSGAAITLHNNLSIKYKVNADPFEAHGGLTNPYVIFKMNGKETKVTEYESVYDDSEGQKYLIFTFKNIAPHQMNDTIYATLYGDYNGTTCFSETREYGVMTYCKNMFAKYSPEEDPEGAYKEIRTLLVDLLGYGAKSQLYMNYNTDNLVDTILDNTMKSWGTEDRTLVSITNPTYASVPNPIVTWCGAGLNLRESIRMNFTLQADDISGMTVEITSGGRTWTIDAKNFTPKKIMINGVEEAAYNVFFSGLNAAQLSDEVFITAYKDGKAVSNTVRYSVESYAYSKQNDADTTLADLVKAMMRYGDAANAYVNN